MLRLKKAPLSGMRGGKLCRGSLMLEYAALFAVVAAALLSMMIYMKRAVAGRYRESADSFGHGRQFEPGVTTDQTGVPVP